MRTQLKPEARDPKQAGPDLDNPPAFDEAGIWMRSEGRQLKISTGADPEADNLDVRPDREDNGEKSAPAAGEHCTPPTREEGDIGGFSGSSRRNLRKWLHAIDRDADALFCTLTYHKHCPAPEEAKTDLDTFSKYVRRHFPAATMVWKLEPQKRGYPHFHCLIFGVDYIPVQKLSEAWHRITGDTSDEHRKSGVDILERSVNQNGKLQAYLAKYMSEEYDVWPEIDGEDPAEYGWDAPGRWWGIYGRDNVPMADWDEAPVYLDRSEAQFLIRELLDEWGSDVPDGVIPPTLTICTRGDPADVLDDLLARL